MAENAGYKEATDLNGSTTYYRYGRFDLEVCAGDPADWEQWSAVEPDSTLESFSASELRVIADMWDAK